MSTTAAAGTRIDPRATALGRRNPAVKLALLLALSCALLLVTDPVTPAVLYAVALGAIVVSRSLDVRTLVRAQMPFLMFGTSIVLVNVLTRPGGAQIAIGPVDVSRAGLALGLSFAARAMLIGVLSIVFVRSTDPARLMVSLHQQARLPGTITYAVLAATRLLDQLPDMMESIRQAHAVRQPDRAYRTAPGRLPTLRMSGSPRSMGAAAFTVLVISLRRGERLAMALQTRALGSGPRTFLNPVTVCRADALLAVGVVVVACAVVAWSSASGFLTGPAALVGR
ncbi:energy-coupling factor transport system permease protein/energy-coupling factor transport system ATP-binding protein [Flavimobilis soli]|uniref:Energy-coupling factor transport system permease protein/energy-coupling factor transport system ATP-binding protein n=1 Tax=Flavimobilis soli TaxID=442709 RepID=A0A2A9EBB0_9MICO|nr:energy-coupling factor transporter transmembrane component T [Flavimobilis soli]PFG35489.1 energy-coupling factor transport system permease protein/energy-coupling factor transport system ATP-binding protein [Flavimobilis soli]